MKINNTQYNFCRLTGITEETYQINLFESGCLYAENYWKNLLPEIEKQKTVKIMLSLTEYWSWWKTQWNIRTQEAFGITDIKEEEKKLYSFEIEALIEAFYDTHCENSYTYIYPNGLVMKALKQKIYGNRTISPKPKTIKRLERNRTRKSSASIEF